MQTSVAVFIAFAVLYFASFVMPEEYARHTVGYTAQATTITGAVATFMVMYTRRIGLTNSLAVLASLSVVAVLSALAAVSCVKHQQCSQTFPVHTLIFSSSFMSGAAAYAGFLMGAAVGLPLWATIVGSIAFAPIFIAVILPYIGHSVNFVLDRVA